MDDEEREKKKDGKMKECAGREGRRREETEEKGKERKKEEKKGKEGRRTEGGGRKREDDYRREVGGEAYMMDRWTVVT